LFANACQTPISLPRLVQKRAESLPATDLIVYDGACGFCTWSLAHVLAISATQASIIPLQFLTDVQLNGLGFSRDAANIMLHFVNSKGAIFTGADAFNELLEGSANFALPLRLLKRYAVLLEMERIAYRWIARNRVVISKILGTSSCAILE